MARKKSGLPKKRSTKLLTVACHLPDDPQELSTHCTASWAGLQKETVLASVVTASAGVPADLAELATCLAAAENGGPAATTALVAAEAKIRQDWHLIALSTQAVLRAGPLEDAPAILANVLMYPSNVGERKPKPPLEVQQTQTWPSGSVHAVALAILGAQTYGWEASLDQVSWVVTTTAQSYTTLTGLTPGKLYYFRVRAFLRDNTMTAYTQTVFLLVR